MSLSKEDVLAALKKEGITNLEELTNAAVDAKGGAKGLDLAVFIHSSYVVTS